MCIDVSNTPGFFTCPLTQNSFGPPFFSGPRPANHSAPFIRIDGRLQSVSTLLTAVGQLYRPDDGRERRLDARLRALPFQRLDERRLLSGFVRAGAAMNDDVAVEAGAEDVLADVSLRVRLGKLRFQDLLDVEELAANVNVGDLRADRPAADQAAFEHQVRVALHQE